MIVKYQSWETPRCKIFKSLSGARPMSRKVCLQCKGGRLLCGHSSCPLLSKLDISNPIEDRLKDSLFGSSTSVFIGWNGYPNVFAGPMTSLDEDRSSVLDNPGYWYGMSFDDIIRMRSLLVRGKQKHSILESSKFVEDMQELALSIKPVDVETHYHKKPQFNLSFSPISQPMGASGLLKDMKIVENPVIPKKVDYVLSDDLRASEQLRSLYDGKFDVYYLSNIFSSGSLGLKNNRRLVPTRWSITAIDDLLGRELMKRIRDYPPTPEYQVYSNTYLENHFDILLIPGGWEFEQFETWAPNTLWTMSYNEPTIIQEHEPHKGRWEYAYNEGGGYYAGRFAVAEALERMRRQARCVVFREVYESYVMPVGVWEVRENVRKAMENKPLKFNTLDEALQDISKRLIIPIDKYVRKSQILQQRRITDFN